MPIRLDISMQCAVKEIELLHDALVKGIAERDAVTSERMAMELYDTVNQLNLSIQCVCYEPTCRYWQHNQCRCGGDQRCLGMGYLVRPARVERETVIEGEMKMAESVLTESDKTRKPDEPFIIWKVRVANKVYHIASQIHNAPDRGVAQWRYESWRTETHITRTNNFMAFVGRLRTLPPEEKPLGMDVSQVVGCSICTMVFDNMECLEAHVDRRRFVGDSLHSNAEAITDTTHERVRPTAPDYRLPMPTLGADVDFPSPPEPEPRHVNTDEMIDRVYREDEEDDDQYRDRFTEYIRVNLHNSRDPEAVGCFHCGRIFKNGFNYYDHAASIHNTIGQRARDDLVR